ncbi:N-6 DNA methylase [Paractinoplanes lichenicola]|uniref:SAM-dependent DNA methyltransferase n=1 Tax=Paractinoplanes lichenicola TaxID=2802976 RepID=A0ABS1VSB1_9ACTN|nr:N-6 DNA methylase [Actinoplanes lichenicola]MBL7257235.1 SAM-dependent DNA methyltransferase [Actinoplanes lichenicola]
MIRPGDSPASRKDRGAFFTPAAIADYLAEWAVAGDKDARILDPTCGEAVFLLAAGRKLRKAGAESTEFGELLYGFDLHQTSLDWSKSLLEEEDLDAQLKEANFFDVPTPTQLGAPVPLMDAVIGNPPFVRYQKHGSEAQAKARRAALQQGVRLSGLTSSWAPLLIHACAFLKPQGRLAMVLPAELLTVGYAEPIRVWLRQRFEQVHLVLFERLQFDDATEKVVLVLASGHGGCDAFSLYYLDDAEDLSRVRPMTNLSVTPAGSGKWTDLLLPNRQRQLFKQISDEHLVPLSSYGSPELGTVTGGNSFFTLNQDVADQFGLSEDAGHLRKVCPPGTKHLKGLTFSLAQWKKLREAGEPVWLLHPDPDDRSPELMAYVRYGEELKVNEAYKCKIRTPWWRPPVVAPPDLFFTYMSHRYPRMFTNSIGSTFLNSMHGIRLRGDVPSPTRFALPLLAFNSATMLGAEIFGRSYGGGILKMEPREAAVLPVPKPKALEQAWALLVDSKSRLDTQLRDGRWTNVVKRVDEALLVHVLGLSAKEVAEIQDAAKTLRARRMGSEGVVGD